MRIVFLFLLLILSCTGRIMSPFLVELAAHLPARPIAHPLRRATALRLGLGRGNFRQAARPDW
jgi:hypothetical protein